MDVLDENEALQQFFEGKSPLGAMVSSRRAPSHLRSLSLSAPRSPLTYALPLEEHYQITPELRSIGLTCLVDSKSQGYGRWLLKYRIPSDLGSLRVK